MLAMILSRFLGLLAICSSPLSAETHIDPALTKPLDVVGPTQAIGPMPWVGPTMPRGASGPTGSTGSTGPYAIGDYAQGGVIFWLDPSGEHGLVCAIVDQDGGNGVSWDNGSYSLIATYADGLYMGAINTATIQSLQAEGIYAASMSADYSVTVGGITYGSWYLPSNIELDLMYEQARMINATAIANGGAAFLPALYWSSNETVNSESYAWAHDFNMGYSNCEDKHALLHVRAIRAF